MGTSCVALSIKNIKNSSEQRNDVTKKMGGGGGRCQALECGRARYLPSLIALLLLCHCVVKITNMNYYLRVLLSLVIVGTVLIYMPNIHTTPAPGSDIDGQTLLVTDGAHVTFRSEPFQKDNCSVRLIKRKRELAQHKPSSKYCTLHHFRRHLQQTGQFMGEGVWFAPPNGTASMDADFYPKGCRFSRRLSTAEALQKCLIRKRVNKIVLSGDSNSDRMSIQLLSYLEELDDYSKCTIKNAAQHNTSYYDVTGNSTDIGKGRSGAIELSYKYRCAFNSSTITVERLAMYQVVDASLFIDNTKYGPFDKRLMHAPTTLEYLLKYYFPHTGFPDIWIYSIPFQHITWGNSVHRARVDINYLLNMLEVYLPRTTTLILVVNARECRVSSKIENIFIRFWNTTRNQRLHEMDQMLYEVLFERIPRFENVYPFLDGDKLSCPLVCLWHENAGHMLEYWYSKMVRYILESFCA